jgi:hypothetical protein
MAVNVGLDINTDRMVLCLDANYNDEYSTNPLRWVDKTNNGDAVGAGTISYSTTNKSFSFSSNGDLFSLSANEGVKNIRGDVSLMGWCKQNSRIGAHQTLLCTDATYRGGLKLLSSYHGNVTAWLGNSDGTDSYTLSGGSIENAGWKFIATTRDVTTGMLRLFVNGTLVNSVTTYTGKTYTTEGPRVGSEYHSGGYYYGGEIATAYAFTRVLPDSEILSIYNKQKSRFGL